MDDDTHRNASSQSDTESQDRESGLGRIVTAIAVGVLFGIAIGQSIGLAAGIAIGAGFGAAIGIGLSGEDGSSQK